MLVVDGQDKIGQLAVNSGVRQNEIIHIKTTFQVVKATIKKRMTSISVFLVF